MALAAGCVSALRKPPTIEQLAGGAVSARPEAAGPLLREAERLFALRDSDSVNRAARACDREH